MQVIFVDADQVVRADMGELYDMDIKGRPLAYTPFCDNNKDMDGYRFWRQVNFIRLPFSFLFFKIISLILGVLLSPDLRYPISFITLLLLFRDSGKIIYGEDHII